MPVNYFLAQKILEKTLQHGSVEEIIQRLTARDIKTEPLPPRIPAGNDHTPAGLEKRRMFLRERNITYQQLSETGPEIEPSELKGNIENFIGFARIPVGVIGPLRINGIHAHGDFYIPMATTEGALVASYHRGAYLISRSGGATVLTLTESVSRAPCFVFSKLTEAAVFLNWVIPQLNNLQEIVATTSKHAKLLDVKTSLIGKEVYLLFEYHTGDASGQNMVTIATEAVCQSLLHKSPIKPQTWFLEGNLSGDKKATMLSFTYARGKQVVAEAIIPKKIIQNFLHTETEQMIRYWQVSVLGGIQSGSIGVQGHIANAFAAMFCACGQDIACVSEAAIGLTRLDITDSGDLYVSIKMPNIIVGTVGGGTHLPTAKECLGIMDCAGADKAAKFAEICAATALAGEISIIGALSAGEFAKAHTDYGRKKKSRPATHEQVSA
jgi:hydroxymethylglutaryl-CoA reductase (NADPH)